MRPRVEAAGELRNPLHGRHAPWRDRRSSPWPLFSFLYTFNDFFPTAPSYTGETAKPTGPSIGLSEFRSLAPGAVEPDDGLATPLR